MFRGLINDAKSAVGAVIGKYVARASVAVPFLIAAGFAIAALTLVLVERFGAIRAYLILAAGFAVLGLVATLFVKVREEAEENAEAEAERNDTPSVAAEAATQAAVQAPLALLGALFSTPLGPSASLGMVRAAGRNLPLIALLGLIVLLFWPRDADSEAAAADGAGDAAVRGAPPPRTHPHANGFDAAGGEIRA